MVCRPPGRTLGRMFPKKPPCTEVQFSPGESGSIRSVRADARPPMKTSLCRFKTRRPWPGGSIMSSAKAPARAHKKGSLSMGEWTAGKDEELGAGEAISSHPLAFFVLAVPGVGHHTRGRGSSKRDQGSRNTLCP